MDAYLSKPIDLAELLDAISTLCAVPTQPAELTPHGSV
jgi:hypothetical protein